VQILTDLVRRQVFRSRSDLTTPVTIVVLTAMLFAAWVWLFIAPPKPWQATFFALLAVSVFLGTSLRSSLRAVRDPIAALSAADVLAELTAGLVLAFALALVFFRWDLHVYWTVPGDFRFVAIGRLSAYSYRYGVRRYCRWVADRAGRRHTRSPARPIVKGGVICLQRHPCSWLWCLSGGTKDLGLSSGYTARTFLPAEA
jgi:hypothetical protein